MATQSTMTSAPLTTRLECPPILLIEGSGADKTVKYTKRHHPIADITIIPPVAALTQDGNAGLWFPLTPLWAAAEWKPQHPALVTRFVAVIHQNSPHAYKQTQNTSMSPIEMCPSDCRLPIEGIDTCWMPSRNISATIPFKLSTQPLSIISFHLEKQIHTNPSVSSKIGQLTTQMWYMLRDCGSSTPHATSAGLFT